MPTTNYDASEITKKSQSRTIYSDYITQVQRLNGGCANRVQLTSGSGSANESSIINELLEGAIFTSPTQQSTIIANDSCPVLTQPRIIPPLRLLILVDTNVAATGTAISNRLTALGYTDAVVTVNTLTSGYTGSGINTSTYSVVLYATNNTAGAAALSTNLKNFVLSGGHLVTAVFLWNVSPSGFDFTLTPFQSSAAQLSDPTCNMTVNIAHPITNGVNTSLTGGVAIFTNTNLSLQPGATKIATFTSSGYPLVAIGTIGPSRLVGLNIGIYDTYLYPNLTNLVVNACLWANGTI